MTPSAEQNYRRALVAHNDGVRALLAATTDDVRAQLRAFRLDLYPLDWLRGKIAQLEGRTLDAARQGREAD